MDAQAARTERLAQHAQIRTDLASCVALARQPHSGARARAALDPAIAQLRLDEERTCLGPPVLRDDVLTRRRRTDSQR